MFAKNFTLALLLSAATLCTAQAPATDTSATIVKHYRLTFVLSYPQGQKDSESFSVDIPVAPGKPGLSVIHLASGLTGDRQKDVTQTWECREVHASTTGLALEISMTSDSEAPALGGISARHQHGAFQRKVDLVLGKPTVVTGEVHVIPLGNTDPTVAAAMAAANPVPRITVTAEEL